MKKISILFLILVSTSSWSATFQSAEVEHPWKDFMGCYTTLERNGQEVPPPPEFYPESEIRFKEDIFLLKDLSNNAIPSMELSVYQGKKEDTYYYDVGWAFSKMGKYSSDKGGEHFQFDDKLIYVYCDQNGCPFTLQSWITIRKMDKDKLFVSIKRIVPELPDESFNSDNVYILRKKTCAK